MSGIIGKKLGMSSLFTSDGKNIPVTIIEAGPCTITNIRTIEKDGYESVQLGYGKKKEKKKKKTRKEEKKKKDKQQKKEKEKKREYFYMILPQYT